ncbi:MAG: hypothetical protein M3393_02575 [Actinomycetota bacterium]|nr:hypothetical protein [Actinomycetota bacterium]
MDQTDPGGAGRHATRGDAPGDGRRRVRGHGGDRHHGGPGRGADRRHQGRVRRQRGRDHPPPRR